MTRHMFRRWLQAISDPDKEFEAGEIDEFSSITYLPIYQPLRSGRI